MRTPVKITATLLVGALALVACGSDDDSAARDRDRTEKSSTTTAPAPEPGAQTIVDIASGDENFSTLVTAVGAAGLVETLSGPGPFTVFAPTNEAFAKIPKDQLDAILADKEQLTAILTYHVLASKVLSTDLQPQQSVATVQGDTVDVQVADGKATINGCNIVTTDIEASNGVIHVIDCVITPPAA